MLCGESEGDTGLVIGFALHNATEGFGIVAALAAAGGGRAGAAHAPGAIGGGPTLIGTLVGRSVINDTLSITFLGLAARSVFDVVIDVLGMARRVASKELTAGCILLGLGLGFASRAVLSVAGASAGS